MIQTPPVEVVSFVRNYVNRWAFERFSQALAMAHSRGIYARPTITSWWRSPAYNVQVGGAARSQHQLGLAVDVAYQSAQDADAAVRQGFGAGLVAVNEGDHVHFQAFPAGTVAWPREWY